MLMQLAPEILRGIIGFYAQLTDVAEFACVALPAASAVGHPGTWAGRVVSTASPKATSCQFNSQLFAHYHATLPKLVV